MTLIYKAATLSQSLNSQVPRGKREKNINPLVKNLLKVIKAIRGRISPTHSVKGSWSI